MTSALTTPIRPAAQTLLRRRPEAWVWVVVVGAWTAMLAQHLASPAVQHHAGHHDPTLSGTVEAAAALGMWALMVLAMMLPTAVPALHVVARASLPRRRFRAQVLVLAGFVIVWLGVGVAPLIAVQVWAPDGPTRRAVTVALLLMAAGHGLTRHQRRALARCHVLASPPPRGARADRACLRTGMRQAASCVVSCGVLMAVLVVDGHSSLALVLLVTAIVWWERLVVARRRRVPFPVPVLMAVSLGLAVG